MISVPFLEPKEWRGVIWEDAEAAQGPEPSRYYSGDDQEEGEEQEGTAASHTGDCGEEVRKTTVWNWLRESLTVQQRGVCFASTALLDK